MFRPKWIVLLLILLFWGLIPVGQPAAGNNTGIYRTTFASAGGYLTIEILDDDLAHFELSLAEPSDVPIWTSPMVAKTDYPGASTINLPASNIIETPEMRLEIDAATLCVTLTDLTRTPELLFTTTCPLSDALDGLSFTQEGTTDLYGLGEYFQRRGGIDQNLMGQRRQMLNPYGNELSRFEGGNVGNAQFPILYALGDGTENYALFLDNVYQQFWNFSSDPFIVAVPSAPIRWYVMTGSDLLDLRHDYMELTGHPPVPPKQMFGLWVSEYGYENWEELLAVMDSLRAAHFPFDGFVLDLFWFGGIPSGKSQMGSLAWDEANFPDPARFIADLREQYGAGIIVIEEPYVSRTALGYDEAIAAGVLVTECPESNCSPILMNEWWGSGGMVDFTDPDAAAWWHDERRQHLIDSGVIGHWTDLGEPEDFVESAWYYGFPDLDLHSHADVHNIYNLLWSESIWDGYQRNQVEQRPFILSRSGTSGSQRYGVAMWSGDIGANFTSLAAHLNAQMHLSLSGMDYFGSDVGGFYRLAGEVTATPDELYTIWLANAALLDVPLRPHTMDLQNEYETAPSLLGDIPSNLANVRLRYALSPYFYTLAHLAYRNGDPVFVPPVYYFQDDPNVRMLGSQKMIGADLMMVTITANEETVPVYLPAGGWFDYYTHEYIESSGEWFEVPVRVDGLLRAPLFVRDGAIIPTMFVDNSTLNILGQREDNIARNEFILTVYASSENGEFTLIEDDSITINYQQDMVRETPISLAEVEQGWAVEIGAASGTYADAPTQRNLELRFITAEQMISGVILNGRVLPELATQDSGDGWLMSEPGVVVVNVSSADITTPRHFEFVLNDEK